jgi:hypothetical protein
MIWWSTTCLQTGLREPTKHAPDAAPNMYNHCCVTVHAKQTWCVLSSMSKQLKYVRTVSIQHSIVHLSDTNIWCRFQQAHVKKERNSAAILVRQRPRLGARECRMTRLRPPLRARECKMTRIETLLGTGSSNLTPYEPRIVQKELIKGCDNTHTHY